MGTKKRERRYNLPRFVQYMRPDYYTVETNLNGKRMCLGTFHKDTAFAVARQLKKIIDAKEQKEERATLAAIKQFKALKAIIRKEKKQVIIAGCHTIPFDEVETIYALVQNV